MVFVLKITAMAFCDSPHTKMSDSVVKLLCLANTLGFELLESSEINCTTHARLV